MGEKSGRARLVLNCKISEHPRCMNPGTTGMLLRVTYRNLVRS